jgi:hypothetical protein
MDMALIQAPNIYMSEESRKFILGLHVIMNRGGKSTAIQELLIKNPISDDTIEDILVVIFHILDNQRGKGGICHSLLKALYSIPRYSDLILNILDLVPVYGSWKDMFKLSRCFENHILEIVEKQFLKDEEELNDYTLRLEWGGEEQRVPEVSLLSKWIPRDGEYLASDISNRLANTKSKKIHTTPMRQYKKRISNLNKLIDTVNIKIYEAELIDHVSSGIQSQMPSIYSSRYDLLRNRVREFLETKND